MPRGLATRVEAQPLDTSRLRAQLRAYQRFGAQFALAQRRVLIGDEMGLGKTVQALAAAAHLAARDQRNVLVVCPASVLLNWEREVRRHTTLQAIVVHGEDRDRALWTWLGHGGVAIATYDMLKGFAHRAEVKPDLLVVDEAHLAKTPAPSARARCTPWPREPPTCCSSRAPPC
jgi:SNF2 family DNA or RNA helicase